MAQDEILQNGGMRFEEEKSSYLKGNREESAANVQKQIDTISSYLPKMLTEEEIKNIILSLEDKSIPSVMKHFKQNYASNCDMGLVNRVLKSL